MSRGLVGAISGSKRSSEWLISNSSGSYTSHYMVFEPGTDNIISYFAYSQVLSKFTKSGTVLWQKQLSIGTTGIRSMVRISDGSIFLYGLLDEPSDKAILVKLDASGNFLWSKTYTAGYEVVSIGNIAANADGSHTYISFTRKVDNGDPNTAVWPSVILKINASNGDVVWSRQIHGSNGLRTYISSMAVGSAPGTSGDLYVVGHDMLNSNFDFRGLLMKYNSSGTLQWQRNIARNTVGAYADSIYLYGIRLDSSDNIYIAGYYIYNAAPVYGRAGYYAKFSSSGTLTHQYGIVSNPISSQNFPVYVDCSEIVGDGSTSYVVGYGYLNADLGTGTYGYIFKINDGVIDYGRVVASNNNAYGEVDALMSDSTHIYFNTSLFSGGGKAGIFKLPADGSKTGKYEFLNVVTSYANAPTQLVTPPVTVSTGTISNTSVTETLSVATGPSGSSSSASFQQYLRRI